MVDGFVCKRSLARAGTTIGTKAKIAQDNWRLYFHLMPETGWMNDPNGLCQFNGVYHFYHQYVPQNPAGKKHPHWGHKTSTNLVDFKEEAIFLSPEHSYDRNGVFFWQCDCKG